MAEQGNDPKCELLDWDAWLDTMPPGPSRLHVAGRARCPSAGFTLEVVRRAPQGINPRDLMLVTREQAPRDGAMVLSEVAFEYQESAPPGQYDTVTLSPGGTKKVRVVS